MKPRERVQTALNHEKPDRCPMQISFTPEFADRLRTEMEIQGHTVKYQGEIIVINDVPAEVCSICGDTLFKPETVRQIERILQTKMQPVKVVPLYEFAW